MGKHSEAMTEILFTDLDSMADRLYVAAQRYCRAFERDMLDEEWGHGKISLARAAEMLLAAGLEYGKAYERAEHAGAFGDAA